MKFSSSFSCVCLMVVAFSVVDSFPEERNGDGLHLIKVPKAIPLVDKWPKSMANLEKPTRKGRNFISTSSRLLRWPGGRVPYELSFTITDAERKKVEEAAKHLAEHTCLKVEPRVDFERDYVFVRSIKDEANDFNCISQIGYRRAGRQMMHLGNSCFTLGTIVHEFLHSFGMLHEFVDPARDSAVDIKWENLKDVDAPQFWKYEFPGVSRLPTCSATGRDGTDYSGCLAQSGLAQQDPYPYDFKSVMHYNATAGSANGRPVFVPKDPEVAAIGGGRLSLLDIYKINHIYSCPQLNAGCPSGGLTTRKESGHITGDETAGSECRWDISVKPGQRIRVFFNSFEFNGACSDNSLTLRQETDGPIQELCATNQPPSVFITKEHEISIKLKRGTGNNSKFRISWEAVKAADASDCCKTVILETSNSDSGVGLSFSQYLGVYTLSATEFTTAFGVNYPVYEKDSDSNLIMDRIARENGQTDFGTPWVVGSRFEKTPGQAAGKLALGPLGLTCPTTDIVFTLPGGRTRDLDARVKCFADCGPNIPSPPAHSVSEKPSDTNFEAVAVYTCVADSSIRLFTTCQQDSTWSKVMGADCPEPKSNASTTESTTASPISTNSSTKSTMPSPATSIATDPKTNRATSTTSKSPPASSSTTSAKVTPSANDDPTTRPGPFMTAELTKDTSCTTITTDGWPFRQAFIFWWFDTNHCDVVFAAVDAPVETDNPTFCNQDYVHILQENDGGVLEEASVDYCEGGIPRPVALPNNNGRRNMLLYDAQKGNGVGFRALICGIGCRA